MLLGTCKWSYETLLPIEVEACVTGAVLCLEMNRRDTLQALGRQL